MTFRPMHRLMTIALLAVTVTLPAQAASTAASLASDSASSTASSASNSIGKSSHSSSPGNDVADGDYRVIDVADLADRPGMVRLTLLGDALAGKPAFELYLPQATLQQAQLATGQQIRTRQRPYGIEFARTDAQAPFFLVLHDAWYQELASRPVTL